MISNKFISDRDTGLSHTVMPSANNTTSFTASDIKEQVDEIIDLFFDSPDDAIKASETDDYQPFSEAMVTRIKFMIDQLNERHAKTLKSESASASASAGRPKATASKSKSKSKSKSTSGERQPNAYSIFMSLLKFVSGSKKDEDLASFPIKAEPHFSGTAEKSRTRYETHQDAIRHNDTPLHGQDVTLGAAYDAITAAHDVDPFFKNAAVRTAILWAMLTVEQRTAVVDIGRAKELCR